MGQGCAIAGVGIVGLLLLAGGCSDDGDASAGDGGPVEDAGVDAALPAASIDYQVRCLDCLPLSADGPARRVMARDGEDGYSVTCEVSEVSGTPVVSFAVAYEDPDASERDFSLSVDHAPFTPNGGESALCRVIVYEGAASRYMGACAAEASASDRPCQVQLAIDGDVVSGTLQCNQIKGALNANLWRYVVAPGTTEDPVSLRIEGCALPVDR